MSNRRRLASEKVRRPRCKRCRGREFGYKETPPVRVCFTCGEITDTEIEATR